jgi:indolepyruvate ferredoxin oxidoreductase alpha subunit
MTGMQEHPGTGRTLEHQPTGKLVLEDLVRAMGVPYVYVIDPVVDPSGFRRLLEASLDSGELAVIISRRNCLLAAGKIKSYEKCDERES